MNDPIQEGFERSEKALSRAHYRWLDPPEWEPHPDCFGHDQEIIGDGELLPCTCEELRASDMAAEAEFKRECWEDR